MKYLIDTSVILELLLEQEGADAAQNFLEQNVEFPIFISDFSLHSIGIILFRSGKSGRFAKFVEDAVEKGNLMVLGLVEADMREVVRIHHSIGLDFDDAYQCAIARKFGLKIVSLDRTPECRVIPGKTGPR